MTASCSESALLCHYRSSLIDASAVCNSSSTFCLQRIRKQHAAPAVDDTSHACSTQGKGNNASTLALMAHLPLGTT